MKKKPEEKKSRTICEILLMCVWVFASVVAAQYIIGTILILILGREALAQPVWTAIYSALSYVAAMILIIFVPPRLKQKFNKKPKAKTKRKLISSEERKNLGLFETPTWTDIGLAPIGFIAAMILAAGLTGIFSNFPWFDMEQAQDVGFNAYMVGMDRVIAFFTLVVVAPIAEEIIFRGWLYGKIRMRLNKVTSNLWSMIISIFVVSLLFGIVHMQWNVGVTVFALSVVLCGLREITGTIYAGILTHMIKNGVAFFLLYVLGV